MHKHDLEFHVDINVINHLGVGLYSSMPAALTELVANAWDADATLVKLDLDPLTRTITLEDDGHGMSVDDIRNKFLKVGYSRRVQSKNKTMSDAGARTVMGRKGIGKLSMFALAGEIRVSSQANGDEAIGFMIDVPSFKSDLESQKTTKLEEFEATPFLGGHGTRIELRNVLTSLNATEANLRVKLARRFSVIDDEHGFEVRLNGKSITKEDRGFYSAVQCLWTFDSATEKQISLLTLTLAEIPGDASSPAKPCKTRLSNVVKAQPNDLAVRGYVASVSLPRQLGSKEDSANAISIFANGRVFAEDVLPEVSNAMYYQNYLVGEVHADFLDDDPVDRATASREAIKRDDPKYQALLRFLKEVLAEIGEQWDEWRSALGLDKSDPQNAAVLEWLETLDDARDKRAATRLMTSIKNSLVHPDEAKNDAAKKILYRGAIVGFEKLRLTKQLDRLERVTDVLGPEFASIFASMDAVEEAAYADITRQRLEVIKKFAEISHDPSALERVAQEYLFEHLWLLDPGWDRVTGRAEMEKTLTKELKKANPDSTGARLDITYRASSGRHIVVELKKPTKTSLNYIDLYQQVTKYKEAVEAYYSQKYPGKPLPVLDICLLLAKVPTGFDSAKQRSLAEMSGRIITYDQLINDAKNAYQEYLSVKSTAGTLEGILSKLV
jgi:hypothetical protein